MMLAASLFSLLVPAVEIGIANGAPWGLGIATASAWCTAWIAWATGFALMTALGMRFLIILETSVGRG